MLVPQTIYRQFGVKVYSCKSQDLQQEQKARKIRFRQYLNRQQNTLIEGDVNDIHPCWKAEREIETKAKNFINYLLNPKSNKKDMDIVLAKVFKFKVC